MEPWSTTPTSSSSFELQDGGGYHVHAPQLPGLHTQGDTFDEAAADGRQAIELYLEGLLDER